MTARKKVVSYVFVPVGKDARVTLQEGLHVRGEILDGEIDTFHTYHGKELTGVEQSADKASQFIDYIDETRELTIDIYKRLENNEHVTPFKVRKTRAQKDALLRKKITRGFPSTDKSVATA